MRLAYVQNMRRKVYFQNFEIQKIQELKKALKSEIFLNFIYIDEIFFLDETELLKLPHYRIRQTLGYRR